MYCKFWNGFNEKNNTASFFSCFIIYLRRVLKKIVLLATEYNVRSVAKVKSKHFLTCLLIIV